MHATADAAPDAAPDLRVDPAPQAGSEALDGSQSDVERRLQHALRAYHALASHLLHGAAEGDTRIDIGRDVIVDLVTAGYSLFEPDDLEAAGLPTEPPGNSDDALQRILQSPEPVPSAVYDRLLASRRSRNISRFLLLAVARADLDETVINQILANRHEVGGAVLKALAANPATPRRHLFKLAEFDYGYIAETLAGNPSLPADLMQRLANDRGYVRAALARRSDLPADLARTFAADSLAIVRDAVAQNPSLSDDIRVLAALSVSSDSAASHQ
jgi:hypothetical protein